MAIPTMALLQQHNARPDIVTEPAVRRHAAIEARELGGIPNCRQSELEAQSGRKNPLKFSNVYQTTLRTTDMIPWHKTIATILLLHFLKKFDNYMTSATYKKNFN